MRMSIESCGCELLCKIFRDNSVGVMVSYTSVLL
jgi:hypothetical protein